MLTCSIHLYRELSVQPQSRGGKIVDTVAKLLGAQKNCAYAQADQSLCCLHKLYAIGRFSYYKACLCSSEPLYKKPGYQTSK